MAALLVRPSSEGDAASIASIYAHHVLHGSGTFELEPPDAAEMARRRREVCRAGWPWLVAERDGRVAGYAYANPFRPRRAYRFCLEDSIYVAPQAQGHGIGRLLLAELLARCTALGARQMLAVIGDADNTASIALHRSLGFAHAGVLEASGWKFDRWVDVVLMQRALGCGAAAPPGDTSA